MTIASEDQIAKALLIADGKKIKMTKNVNPKFPTEFRLTVALGRGLDEITDECNLVMAGWDPEEKEVVYVFLEDLGDKSGKTYRILREDDLFEPKAYIGQKIWVYEAEDNDVRLYEVINIYPDEDGDLLYSYTIKSGSNERDPQRIEMANFVEMNNSIVEKGLFDVDSFSLESSACSSEPDSDSRANSK